MVLGYSEVKQILSDIDLTDAEIQELVARRFVPVFAVNKNKKWYWQVVYVSSTLINTP